MPDSNYTTTPPSATEMQILAMGDKVNDICENVKKLSDLPQKIDRMSMQIEQINKDHEKTRSELERTKDHFEEDINRVQRGINTEIEKMKSDAALREEKLAKVLEPLIKSETKVSLILAIVAGSGIFILGLVFTAWNMMSTRVDANTSRSMMLEKSVETASRDRDQLAVRVKDIESYQRDLERRKYDRGEYEK